MSENDRAERQLEKDTADRLARQLAKDTALIDEGRRLNAWPVLNGSERYLDLSRPFPPDNVLQEFREIWRKYGTWQECAEARERIRLSYPQNDAN